MPSPLEKLAGAVLKLDAAANGTVSSSQTCLGTTVKLQLVPEIKLTDSFLKLQQYHTV